MPPKGATRKDQIKNSQMEKEAAVHAVKEARDAKNWEVGAKDNSKSLQSAEKDAEKARKAKEKAALEAQENASMGASKVKKTKKKGKDDFDLLNAALAKQPKTKAQKEAEERQKVIDEKKKKDEIARKAKEAAKAKDMEEINKLAAKGIVTNHSDDLFIPINNHLDEDEEDASGIDNALNINALSVSSSGKGYDEHPERNQKVAHQAFYDREIYLFKQDYPGLKLSQYKERIFEKWKLSPENPANIKKNALQSQANSVFRAGKLSSNTIDSELGNGV
jgi:hypothetical protein